MIETETDLDLITLKILSKSSGRLTFANSVHHKMNMDWQTATVFMVSYIK